MEFLAFFHFWWFGFLLFYFTSMFFCRLISVSVFSVLLNQCSRQEKQRIVLSCWVSKPGQAGSLLGLPSFSCETYPPLVQMVPAITGPVTYNSNQGLFSPKVKSP